MTLEQPCNRCNRHPQLDRRTLLDNLALVLLSIDELVDAGRILEIDPSAIANRVLMRGADARGPQNPELTVQQVRMYDTCGRVRLRRPRPPRDEVI